jgi:hypothetical protein
LRLLRKRSSSMRSLRPRRVGAGSVWYNLRTVMGT